MTPPQSKSRFIFRLLLACIGFLAFATFFQVIKFKFLIYDDPLFVSENPFIRDGFTWAGIKWAFAADLTKETIHADYWQPITFLSRLLDIQIFGLDPAGHHLTNLFIHILNIYLLFYFLYRSTNALWKSAVVTALFAIHPLQAGTIAWVTERKGLLSTLFGLLALIQYLKYTQTFLKKDKHIVTGCFALSLMSKPALITLPIIFLLLDFWPLNRIKQIKQNFREFIKIIFEKYFWFLMSLTSVLITSLLSAHRTFLEPAKKLHLINIPVSYVQYILNFLNPSRLFVIYPYQHSIHPIWLLILSAMLLILVSLLAIKKSGRCPYLLVGWFWFLIVLSPFVWLIRLETRFMYFSLIGLSIFFVWGFELCIQKIRCRPIVPTCIGILLITLLTLTTYRETGFWKDDSSLFRRAKSLLADDRTVNHLYAISLVNQGKIDDAIPYFLKMLTHTFDDAKIYNNVGALLLDNGRFEQAVSYYEKAVQANPHYFVGYNNLCDAYSQFNRFEEALTYCQQAIAIKSDFPEPYFILGTIMKSKGEIDKAVQYFSQAIQFGKEYAAAYHERGKLLAQNGRVDEAISDFNIALALNPRHVEFCNSMGNALSIQNKLTEAMSFYQKALTLDPKNAQAYNNAGNVLTRAGRFQEAILNYQKAIKFNPDYAEAYNNMAVALMESNELDKAEENIQKALQINPSYLFAQRNLERLQNLKIKKPLNP